MTAANKSTIILLKHHRSCVTHQVINQLFFCFCFVLPIECGNHMYGSNCNHPCGNCSKGEKCHHISGICPNGCDAGVFGSKCEKGYFT